MSTTIELAVATLLRCVIVLACLATVVLHALSYRWNPVLQNGDSSHWLHTRSTPMWQAPPLPNYAEFAAQFDDLPEFPAADTPDLQIRAEMHLIQNVIGSLFGLWLVSLLVLPLSVVQRHQPRDWFLHFGLACCAGLTTGWFVGFAALVLLNDWHGNVSVACGLVAAIGVNRWMLYPIRRIA